jgi:hypothetical protein
MVYRFCKNVYIPISNPEDGDENISSFSAMKKDQTPLFIRVKKEHAWL